MPRPLMPLTSGQRQTAAARETHKKRGVERALDDPVKLERAARIVRVALERGRLTLADLDAERQAEGGAA